MNFKDFQEVIKNTRCTRRFKADVNINKEELIELIDLARTVSSGKNIQPLKYIAITDDKIKAEVYKPLVWAAHLADWEPSSDEKPSAYILVLNDKTNNGFSAIDSGIAMQTIRIGATIKGYDSCIMASIDKIAYSNLFNLNENIEPMFIIALGVKNEIIKLTEVTNKDTNYFREQEIHCVPKRALQEVLINEK